MNNEILDVGLDVDGVCGNFQQRIIDHAKAIGLGADFPVDSEAVDYWDVCPKFRETFTAIMMDEDFWKDVPPLTHRPDFRPAAYVTARPIGSHVTEQWLERNGFPKAPVVTVDVPEKKLAILHDLGLDVFIDDYYKTIAHIRDEGIELVGLLFEAPYQRGHTAEIRGMTKINNLKYETIADAYGREQLYRHTRIK